MSYNYSISNPDKYLIIEETSLNKAVQEHPATTIDKKNFGFDHNIRKFNQNLLTIETDPSQINRANLDQSNQNLPIKAKAKLHSNSKSHHSRTTKNVITGIEFPLETTSPESVPHNFQPHGDIQFAR